MSLIFRPPWTRQPPSPVRLDRANPLTQGMVRCVVFNVNGATGAPIDLVTGDRVTVVGSSISTAFTSKGRGQNNTAENSYWTLPVRTETVNKLSMGWVGLQSGGTAPIIVRDATSAGGSILFWSNGGWGLRLGGTTYTSAGTLTNGQIYSAAVTSSATAGKTFVDGKLVVNGGTPGASALVSPWYIHQNGTNGVQGALATSLLLVVWDRTLSDTEAQTWTTNPWSIFLPQTRTLWAPASGVSAYDLPVDPGSYTTTGSDLTLLVDRIASVDAGSYALTGSDVSFALGYGLSVDEGSYTLTGEAVTLLVDKILSQDAGSYTITGADVTLTYTPATTYELTVDPGSYSITGSNPTLLVDRSVIPDAGAYTLSGSDVTMVYSGGSITIKAGSWIRYRTI